MEVKKKGDNYEIRCWRIKDWVFSICISLDFIYGSFKGLRNRERLIFFSIYYYCLRRIVINSV